MPLINTLNYLTRNLYSKKLWSWKWQQFDDNNYKLLITFQPLESLTKEQMLWMLAEFSHVVGRQLNITTNKADAEEIRGDGNIYSHAQVGSNFYRNPGDNEIRPISDMIVDWESTQIDKLRAHDVIQKLYKAAVIDGKANMEKIIAPRLKILFATAADNGSDDPTYDDSNKTYTKTLSNVKVSEERMTALLPYASQELINRIQRSLSAKDVSLKYKDQFTAMLYFSSDYAEDARKRGKVGLINLNRLNDNYGVKDHYTELSQIRHPKGIKAAQEADL